MIFLIINLMKNGIDQANVWSVLEVVFLTIVYTIYWFWLIAIFFDPTLSKIDNIRFFFAVVLHLDFSLFPTLFGDKLAFYLQGWSSTCSGRGWNSGPSNCKSSALTVRTRFSTVFLCTRTCVYCIGMIIHVVWKTQAKHNGKSNNEQISARVHVGKL